MPRPSHCSGFTFLEAVLAGLMIALLTAIAIPSYKHHLLHSHRALGQEMLLDLSARQEMQALKKGRYATALVALVGSSNSNPGNFFLNRNGDIAKTVDVSGSSIYKIELLDASATSFLLSATAVGNQTNDKNCAVLTLASTGQKSARTGRGGDPARCW